MKKICSALIALLFLGAPALSFADTGIPIGPTPLQLATRVAALEAQVNAAEKSAPLACAMRFSATTASLGQQVILAWGSVGAVEQSSDPENSRPTDGAITLQFEKAGTWTYTFKFYDAGGNSVTCNAAIKVQ